MYKKVLMFIEIYRSRCYLASLDCLELPNPQVKFKSDLVYLCNIAIASKCVKTYKNRS